MINELSTALERNELSVVYQPQVDIRTGSIIGNEVLLRWQHAKFGHVPPSVFIPLAEESGAIIAIGEWVLRKACAQNKAWLDAGMTPMEVSVNLSPLQFMQPDFVDSVRTILAETGLPPQYLDVEITEGMAMDINHVLSTLQQLKETGVRISMDDFGKGYSSLYYLKRLPLDTLKIDKSFVNDCITDENDAILVKTIISMARHLKLNVIAEGVETREQLQFLQQNLCDAVQGYLFSEPLTAEELVEQLPLIQNKMIAYGMDDGLSEKMWLEEQLRIARQDLEDTLRKQQGMTFKFRKQNGHFVHTLCDGELLYRMGLTPAQVIGKEWHAFFPGGDDLTYDNYMKAWQGEAQVTFEKEVSGVCVLCTLRPIKRGGRVVEVIGNAIDISERKRMEEELRAAKDQLESFFNHTSDAIAVVGKGQLIRRVNAAYIELFGWSSEELVGYPIPNVPGSLMSETLSIIEQAFNGQAASNHETFRQRKDGSIVHVSLTLSPIKDCAGKTVEVAAVTRDISERKQAEAALKESEERYRQLIHMSPDIVIVHDQGKVLFMNQAGKEVERTFDEDISSKCLYAVLVPEQREEAAERARRLLNGEKLPPVERTVINGRGEIMHVEVSSAPVVFEGKRVIQIVARDISERKRNEEALRLIIEQYRVIAESMDDLVMVLDSKGGVTFASASHESVLGYPSAYYNRQTVMNIVHPNDRRLVTKAFMEIKRSRSPRQVEFKYRHQAGSWVCVAARGTPILSMDGQLHRVILVSRYVAKGTRAGWA